MNLAALAQSQTLATLLQALDPATELGAGGTVEARLIALASNGTATARVGSQMISLILAGPQAKQAELAPGSVLLLKLTPPDKPGAPVTATLVEARPAPGSQALPVRMPSPTDAASPPPSSPLPLPVNAVRPSLPAADPQQPGTATAQFARPPGAPATLAQPASLAAGLAASVTASPATAGTATQPPAAQAAAPAPRVAAGPLLGAALANQDSLAPLFANLRSLAHGRVGTSVPAPFLKLANQILAQALPAEGGPLSAVQLKQAVQRSGLFLEARPAQGQATPSPQTDLKAGLLALRAALAPFMPALSDRAAAKPLLSEASAAVAGQPARPGTPRRDGPLAPQPIAEPTLAAGERPAAVAETLFRQTEAALDRITLSQFASLPADGQRSDPAQAQRWLAEVPLAFHNGTAMLPLHVEREPARRGPSGMEAPLWRLRFALDVEPMGPLQGIVSLQGRSVGVTLWAEREATSRLLRGATPGLEAALAHADFETGGVDIHTGQPRTLQPTAGQFLDRMS